MTGVVHAAAEINTLPVRDRSAPFEQGTGPILVVWDFTILTFTSESFTLSTVAEQYDVELPEKRAPASVLHRRTHACIFGWSNV